MSGYEGDELMNDAPSMTLRRFLLEEQRRNPAMPNLAPLLVDVAQATRRIAHLVGRGALGGVLGSAGVDNVQGEEQKKLDILSNDIMIDALEWTGHWSGLASEEMSDVVAIDPGYRTEPFLCLFDPLDGSSNIDVNGSVGTIFSILERSDLHTPLQSGEFLQPGIKQLAAGFAVYGPSTVLVVTVGNGVNGFTLDRGTGEYVLSHPGLRIPADTHEFTVNISNRRYWEAPMVRYVDECMQGSESARGIHFSMRYVGSMVADVFRVLCNGGVFLYPYDSRDPDKPGKLRLLYEANPMSFVVEQAGGASSTSRHRIMEISPAHLHERCPVVMGARNEVERIVRFHAEAG